MILSIASSGKTINIVNRCKELAKNLRLKQLLKIPEEKISKLLSIENFLNELFKRILFCCSFIMKKIYILYTYPDRVLLV